MQETHVDGAPLEVDESPRWRSIRITRPVRESRWRKRVHDREVNKHGFSVGTRPIVIDTGAETMTSTHRALPFADASIDEIALEDVLEYVRDDRALYAELNRIMRPGGTLHLRVPNNGPLAGFDSLNLYKYFTDITRRGLRVPETDEIAFRRHLSLEEIGEALGPDFAVINAWTTSLALAELANVIALAALTWWPESPKRYQKIRPLIDRFSRLEAKVKPDGWGYWLHVEARKVG